MDTSFSLARTKGHVHQVMCYIRLVLFGVDDAPGMFKPCLTAVAHAR
jgi:hypothetical protein